jgi:hypothetical protein
MTADTTRFDRQLTIEEVAESFEVMRKYDRIISITRRPTMTTRVLSVGTKVLSFLALPFLLVAMLVAPLMGVHFCPQEAMPLMVVAGSLPFIGPAVRRLRERFGRKNHCCDPNHNTVVFDPTPGPDGQPSAEAMAITNQLAGVSEDILPPTCADGHVGCHGDEPFADEASADGKTICYCTRIRGIHGRRVGCP